MKKIISLFLLTAILSINLFSFTAFAGDAPSGTLLPKVEKDFDCVKELAKLENVAPPSSPAEEFKKDTKKQASILGCAIKTGKIRFWMIPYFVVYIIEFLVGISGLVAVLFIVIGGYQFIIAGATDKKDTAKATIRNAVLGLILVSVAWVIINIIQFALTI